MAKRKTASVKTASVKTRPDNEVYRHTPNVIFKTYAGKCLMFNLKDSRRIFELDGIAVEIWKRMNGRVSLAKIIDAVGLKHRDVSKSWLLKNTIRLVADLKRSGLIEKMK